MEDLPVLVYENIFKKNFTVNERTKLRLVCKKWKQLIEFFGQERLVVCPKVDYCFGYKWSDTGKLIAFADKVFPVTVGDSLAIKRLY